MIVALNVVLPYGVAFKIVAVLGIVTPAVLLLGVRSARPVPVPDARTVRLGRARSSCSTRASRIYGGNVKSTMAGEFSFSIALSLGHARPRACSPAASRPASTATGRPSLLALAMPVARHRGDLRGARRARCCGWSGWTARASSTASPWASRRSCSPRSGSCRSCSNHAYMTDMKYGVPARRRRATRSGTCSSRSPRSSTSSSPAFAVIGFVGSVVRRHLNGSWLGIIVPRARWPPCTSPATACRSSGCCGTRACCRSCTCCGYLLMMVGIVEIARYFARANGVRDRCAERHAMWIIGDVRRRRRRRSSVLVDRAVFCSARCPVPGSPTQNGKPVDSWCTGWGPITLTATVDRRARRRRGPLQLHGLRGHARPTASTRRWSTRWRRSAPTPTNGCGRALWENNGDNGKYGTTMALMLLPHWTDGCIGSAWRVCSSRRRAPRRTTSSPPRR